MITTVGSNVTEQNSIEVLFKNRKIKGITNTYAEGGDLFAIAGSYGNLEHATRNGSAALEMEANIGDEVVVELSALSK